MSLYQYSDNTSYPNFRIWPDSEYTNETETPFVLTFLPSPQGEVVLEAEYSRPNNGDLVYRLAAVDRIGKHKNKTFLLFLFFIQLVQMHMWDALRLLGLMV